MILIYAVGVLILFLFLSMASAKMSDILMRGSIFHSLRKAIKDRAEEGSAVFEKLDDLFLCRMCMSSQVSIWLASLPMITIVHLIWSSPLKEITGKEILFPVGIIFFLTSAFLLGMAIAYPALILMNLSIKIENKARSKADTKLDFDKEDGDIEPDSYNNPGEQYHAFIANLRKWLKFIKNTDVDQNLGKGFNSALIQVMGSLTEKLKDPCDNISCGYGRRDCRQSNDIHFIISLILKLNELLPEYYRWRRRNRRGTPKRFLQER